MCQDYICSVKTCNKCKESKSSEDFSNQKRYLCKLCVSKYNKNYNKKNSDIIRKNRKEYALKNNVSLKESKKK